MNSKRLTVASVAVLALVIAGTVIGLLWTGGGSSDAQSGIYVFDGSQPGATATAFESEGDAVAAASKLAGFEVRLPSYLPTNWKVTGINLGPELVGSSTLRTATLTIRDGSAGAKLVEANQPGGTASGAAGPPFGGGQFSSYLTSTGKNYTMILDGDGFTLTLPFATPIDDVEAAKILGSLKTD